MACASVLAIIAPPILATARTLPDIWTTTWEAPMVSVTPTSPSQYEGQTIRTIAHISAGGHAIRLRISNEFGTDYLKFGEIHLAASAGNSVILSGTDHLVTFAGRKELSVPVGATAVSDPVSLEVPPGINLTISLYVTKTNQISDHQNSEQYSYVANGDLTAAKAMPGSTTIYDRPFLTGIDVLGSPIAGSVVALGDSITDGNGSDTNQNDRWPDDLATRLIAADNNRVGVGNAGISGNALISRPAPTNPVATGRFNQDVLAQPGRHWVILLEGINDIGNTLCCGPAPSADELISADRELIATAHGMGLKIFAMTLLPYQGAFYYTAAGEQKRERLNAFIRDGGEFDAVFDTDAALRDPKNLLQLNPIYDSGDHLHPNAAGDQVIADTVDISLFRQPPPAAR